MDSKTYVDNAEAIEAWNGVLFDKFARFRETLTTGLGAHGEALLERFPPRPGERVLDVGCGFGDTTITLARLVGAGGDAVGVDAAARFVETGRRDAAAQGVHNARFLVADVEREVPGGPYDRAFARFGTMFFANPVAALRNVRKVVVPGGVVTFVVWRRKDENACWYDPEQRVLSFVQPPEQTTAPTCGPGPFSMSSPDVVSAQLVAAGFERIAFERHDREIRVGKDIDDAIAFSMALGPAGEVMRLAGAEAERRKPEIMVSLREMLAPLARPDGVYAKSSSWLVSARVA
ncbi:MAG TPA: class I SAM-dependent methyltransferase [Polyangiaceae bacterium]|jgi:ubiquinone/menaquinone biosynthesis C-methylase UbiE